MCGGAPVQPIVMIFSTARDLADIIKRAKFYIDRFLGFGPSMGQIWGFPIGNRNGPYRCVALTCTHVINRIVSRCTIFTCRVNMEKKQQTVVN